MALVPIKTASTTGYCDCIHGCYELASLRDEDTGKSYCPRCSKEHLEMNAGLSRELRDTTCNARHASFGRSTGTAEVGFA
jgi:hypothetical protein